MPTRQGALILADISGYTSFVTTTEIDHSHEIVNELIQTITAAVGDAFEVAELEGDAVFLIGEKLDASTLDILERAFVAFQRRLRDVETVTTCRCRACATAGALTLKFVVHWGDFIRQEVAGRQRSHGADVIIVHRLLKNSVPGDEYILATDAALERLPHRRGSFRPHTETYDVGTVRGAYLDLTAERESARQYQREHVAPADAHVRAEHPFPLPVGRLWSWFEERPRRLTYLSWPIWREMAVQRVDATAGARGTLLGSEFHCHHGQSASDLTVFHTILAERPRSITLHVVGDRAGLYATLRFAPSGLETTDVDVALRWEENVPRTEVEAFDAALRAELERVAAAVRTPAYVIGRVRWTDDAGRREYASKALGLIKQFGGRYLVGTERFEDVEGDRAEGVLVVLEFPDIERARAWYASAEYRPLKEIRQASSVSTLTLVEGVPKA